MTDRAQETTDMMKRLTILTAVLVMATLAGCRDPKVEVDPPNYAQPLGPGQWALRKITDPAEIPDFTPALGDVTGLRTSLANSLNYLAKPTSRKWYDQGFGGITHDHVIKSLTAFDGLLATTMSPAAINAAIRSDFDVYTSVGWNGKGGVLFTGYYTPIFRASRTRTEMFTYPLYKMPADLVKADDGTILGRKGPDGRVVAQYPSREDIEATGILAGTELVWLSDPFEVYICHVQGSARLRLPDGEMMSVGYTANNGHEYRSVAKMLIENGKMSANAMSLQAMIEYFKSNPDDVDRYVRANPRYVFFVEEMGTARGSLNEPVTPMRSIATDKAIYPPAAMTFLSVALPRRTAQGIQPTPTSLFALDQDTGGAIRAPGRCDIYMGTGDEAGQLAGRTYAEGRLYYLFLKPTN